jgi:hypothetical protein
MQLTGTSPNSYADPSLSAADISANALKYAEAKGKPLQKIFINREISFPFPMRCLFKLRHIEFV